MEEFFDQASVSPGLFIRGKKRFITKFGTAMTILGYLTILGLSFYFLLTFFMNKSLNVLNYTEHAQINVTMNLTYTPFMFRLIDQRNNLIDWRVASIIPAAITRNISGAFVNQLETEPCEFNVTVSDYYKNYLKDINISTLSCFNPNLNLTMFRVDQTEVYYNIYVVECVNSTDNNNGCYPKDYIKRTISETIMFMNYYFPSDNINHLNQENPVTSFYVTEDKRLSYDFLYTFIYYFTKVDYESDVGPVFEDIRRDEGFTKDLTASTFVTNLQGFKTSFEGTFAIFQFRLINNYSNKYIRSYEKFQSVIANIGGAANSIMVLVCIVTSFITEKMFHVSLSKYVVSFDAEEDQKKINSNIDKKVIIGTDSTKKLANVKTGDFEHYKKFEKVRCRDVLFKHCLRKNSLIHIEKKFEYIYRKKMSVDFLMRYQTEFDKLKYLLFDYNEQYLFDNMKNYHIKTVLRNLESRHTVDYDNDDVKKEIKKALANINPDDRISRNMIKSYREPKD
jgi:hypothetical protein